MFREVYALSNQQQQHHVHECEKKNNNKKMNNNKCALYCRLIMINKSDIQ